MIQVIPSSEYLTYDDRYTGTSVLTQTSSQEGEDIHGATSTNIPLGTGYQQAIVTLNNGISTTLNNCIVYITYTVKSTGKSFSSTITPYFTQFLVALDSTIYTIPSSTSDPLKITQGISIPNDSDHSIDATAPENGNATLDLSFYMKSTIPAIYGATIKIKKIEMVPN